MKTRTIRTDDETIVVAGMITDPAVLARVAERFNPEMFRSRWAGLVARWAVGYWQRHGNAPGSAIRTIYERWAAKTDDPETAETVARYLSLVSERYSAGELAAAYVLETADAYFNRVKLGRLIEELETELDGGNVAAALDKQAAWNRLDFTGRTGVNPFADRDRIEAAFADSDETLISWPGDFGRFFRGTFERDSFVAFMAPEKRGKSFWLLDVAWRAMRQGRRTAYFEAGDMSEAQVIRRIASRAAGRPRRPKTVNYPTRIYRAEEGGPISVDYEERIFKEPLDAKTAWAGIEKTNRRNHRAPLFRMVNYPNSTLTVARIEATLADWTRDGWPAEVVLIDYADILAPPAGVAEPRERINENWKALRGLSQKIRGTVVTATQADAKGAEAETLGRSNFSDDKRKYAHVTAMLGINQSAGDKTNGVHRINFLVYRDDEFETRRTLNVAGCLALARPTILGLL